MHTLLNKIVEEFSFYSATSLQSNAIFRDFEHICNFDVTNERPEFFSKV